MKRTDLVAQPRALGWQHLRQGGSHEVWANASGKVQEAIPRHREINELLARKILKTAKGNP